MSEQTPNSSEDLSGAEPSMEDILASIRKIISDDEPVAMESPEDVTPVDLVETSASAGLDDMMAGIHTNSKDLTSDAVLDRAGAKLESQADEGDSVDLNINDVLAGLDEDVLATDFEDVSLEDDALTTLVSTEDLSDADDDILSFLDADIPLTEAGAIETANADIAADDDLGMDNLLEDILMSPLDDEAGDAFDKESIKANLSAETATSAEDTDLALVKSLMADLADDPDGLETDEDLDALLAIPEVEEGPDADDQLAASSVDLDVSTEVTSVSGEVEAEGSLVESEAVESEAEDDILGNILDMAIEDELQSHPDDLISLDAVLDAEQANIAENSDSDEDLPSLSEIAAAAEADAVAVETAVIETAQAPQAIMATAGLAVAAGGAVLGSTDLGSPALDSSELNETSESEAEIEFSHDDVEVETEFDTAETKIKLITEPISIVEETSMPVKAVQTDAILDEVTETAAAGAFAELNQVVEEKAVFNESGPRIGDLVQDALRPMLKEWLDANLKGIVERAVAKEVKRISSGK